MTIFTPNDCSNKYCTHSFIRRRLFREIDRGDEGKSTPWTIVSHDVNRSLTWCRYLNRTEVGDEVAKAIACQLFNENKYLSIIELKENAVTKKAASAFLEAATKLAHVTRISLDGNLIKKKSTTMKTLESKLIRNQAVSGISEDKQLRQKLQPKNCLGNFLAATFDATVYLLRYRLLLDFVLIWIPMSSS